MASRARLSRVRRPGMLYAPKLAPARRLGRTRTAVTGRPERLGSTMTGMRLVTRCREG